MTRLEAFPGSMGSATSPKRGLGSPLRLLWGPDFPGPRPTGKPVVYQRHGWPTLLRPSIAQTPCSRCRNINLLSIAYGFRPRLRSRLTLGRLALPRNPWAFGGRVSRPSFVTHASILSPDPSTADKAYAAASLVTGCSPTTPESRDPPESAASVNDF
jgi:hypothetical protein